MVIRLQREIEKLREQFMEMAGAVEETVKKTIFCVNSRDKELAEKIASSDHAIDKLEVELEESCLKVLALYQPVATDLRFIVTALKANSDLERIADLAANICERVIFLVEKERFEFPFDFNRMSAVMLSMLKKSIDALVSADKTMAYEVILMDSEIDEIHKEMYKKVAVEIRKNPENIELMINVVGISRYIERLADHITNIAEDIIYMIDGEIIRHNYKKI